MSEPDKSAPPGPAGTPDKPKSMAEFDYFAEDIDTVGVGRGELSLAALQKRKRRLLFLAALIAVVCALLLSLVWGLRGTIAYHFRAEDPLVLGRVDEIEGALPSDRWVRLSGVTEARAAQVKWIRGLDWRANYKYFHLLGSPVFIEIPADGSQGTIEAFANVELSGRLIDLSQTREYDRLLDFLEDKLRMHRPAQPFMLQVGVVPDGGKRAIVLLLVVIMIPVINVVLWLRAWRRLKRRI